MKKKLSKKAATAKAAKKKAAKKAATKKSTTKKSTTKKKSAKKAKKAAKAKKKSAKKMPAVKRAAKKSAKNATSAKKATKKKSTKKAAAPKTAAAPVRKKKAAKVAKRSAPPPELPLGARAAPLPEPVTTPGSPGEILLALGKLLLDDAQFLDDLRLAVTSPQDYFDVFAEELNGRGVEGPQPNLPWVALIEGLSERDALVELDGAFEPDDLSDALQTLVGQRKVKVDLSGLPGYDDSAGALAAVGDRLLEAGLALVTVRPNDAEDLYPIAILPADRVEHAQELAASLGLGSIERWSSDDITE